MQCKMRYLTMLVMVCVGGMGLAIYGLVIDVATSPMIISITNGHEKSLDLAIDIENAFPAEAVAVRFDDFHRLNMIFINSTVSQLTLEEQKAEAAKIAELAWQDNRVNSRVRFIRIAFVEKSRLLGIPFSSTNLFLFSKADLLQE